MAFRRSLTARAKLFYQQQQQQRVALPLSRVDRDDNDRRRQDLPIYDFRRVGRGNVGSFRLSGWRNLCGDRRFAAPAAYTPIFVRNMSSYGEGRGTENVPITTDSFEMMKETVEKAFEAVAPMANEAVAAAIVDVISYSPFGGLLYLINLVHFSSGCNWCASIALSTILLRTLLLPFTIHQTKATYIFTLIRPQVEEIQEEITKGRNEKNPIAAAVAEARMRKLFDEYRFNRFSNVGSYSVLASVNACFYFAILIMNAAKLESLNDGGAFFIFPLLTAFTFWRAMKCHGDAYISDNQIAVAALLIVPYAALFPKGVLCYWIASNLYGLAYGTMMKNGKVKKMLGIPNVTEAPRFDPDLYVMPASFGESFLPILLFLGYFCYYLLKLFGIVA